MLNKKSIFDYINKANRLSNPLLIFDSNESCEIGILDNEREFIKKSLTLSSYFQWMDAKDKEISEKINKFGTFSKEWEALTDFALWFSTQGKKIIFNGKEIEKIWLFEKPDFVILVDNNLVLLEATGDRHIEDWKQHDKTKELSNVNDYGNSICMLNVARHYPYFHKIEDSTFVKHIKKTPSYYKNVFENYHFFSTTNIPININKIFVTCIGRGFQPEINETKELIKILISMENEINNYELKKFGVELITLLNFAKSSSFSPHLETLNQMLKRIDSDENEK